MVLLRPPVRKADDFYQSALLGKISFKRRSSVRDMRTPHLCDPRRRNSKVGGNLGVSCTSRHGAFYGPATFVRCLFACKALRYQRAPAIALLFNIACGRKWSVSGFQTGISSGKALFALAKLAKRIIFHGHVLPGASEICHGCGISHGLMRSKR